MESWITPSNITFVVGMLGLIFTIYNYFRAPQVKGERADALIRQKEELKSQEYERRFKDVDAAIKDVTTLSQNHIHSVDVKVDSLSVSMIQMGKDIVKISTILEERLPPRK